MVSRKDWLHVETLIVSVIIRLGKGLYINGMISGRREETVNRKY